MLKFYVLFCKTLTLLFCAFNGLYLTADWSIRPWQFSSQTECEAWEPLGSHTRPAWGPNDIFELWLFPRAWLEILSWLPKGMGTFNEKWCFVQEPWIQEGEGLYKLEASLAEKLGWKITLKNCTIINHHIIRLAIYKRSI